MSSGHCLWKGHWHYWVRSGPPTLVLPPTLQNKELLKEWHLAIGYTDRTISFNAFKWYILLPSWLRKLCPEERNQCKKKPSPAQLCAGETSGVTTCVRATTLVQTSYILPLHFSFYRRRCLTIQHSMQQCKHSKNLITKENKPSASVRHKRLTS